MGVHKKYAVGDIIGVYKIIEDMGDIESRRSIETVYKCKCGVCGRETNIRRKKFTMMAFEDRCLCNIIKDYVDTKREINDFQTKVDMAVREYETTYLKTTFLADKHGIDKRVLNNALRRRDLITKRYRKQKIVIIDSIDKRRPTEVADELNLSLDVIMAVIDDTRIKRSNIARYQTRLTNELRNLGVARFQSMHLISDKELDALRSATNVSPTMELDTADKMVVLKKPIPVGRMDIPKDFVEVIRRKENGWMSVEGMIATSEFKEKYADYEAYKMYNPTFKRSLICYVRYQNDNK